MNHQSIRSSALILCMGLLLLPALAAASSMNVQNSVVTSSDSGGNSASGAAGSNGSNGTNGTVIRGQAMNSVSITTTVNGQVVEQYAATSSDPIEYSHSTDAPGVKAAVSATAGATAGAVAPAKAYQPALPAVRPSIEERATIERESAVSLAAAVRASSTAASATAAPYATSSVSESRALAIMRSVQLFISSLFGYVFNLY